jgi:serine protease inhibitor
MFIILPHDIDGISKLEDKLAKVDLSKVLKHLPVREVRVSIPRFRLEETTDFNNILKQVCVCDCPSSNFPTNRVDFLNIKYVWSWHCNHV